MNLLAVETRYSWSLAFGLVLNETCASTLILNSAPEGVKNVIDLIQPAAVIMTIGLFILHNVSFTGHCLVPLIFIVWTCLAFHCAAMAFCFHMCPWKVCKIIQEGCALYIDVIIYWETMRTVCLNIKYDKCTELYDIKIVFFSWWRLHENSVQFMQSSASISILFFDIMTSMSRLK